MRRIGGRIVGSRNDKVSSMIINNYLRICGSVGDDNGGMRRRDLCHCIFPFDVFGCLRKDPITKGGKVFTELGDHVCPKVEHGRGWSWYHGPCSEWGMELS